MAAARSQLHLGSPPRKASYGPRAPTPQPLVLCNRIPGQPLHQDGRTLVPLAQAVPLQVDMAMALQRVRISENYETDLLLRVKDISHFLMQDIAFLSGGRGKDNASIITFPENCNFRYIPEDVIAKVLTYLMSVARQNGSDSRFTLIVDRRLDTWFSLKISLQKISASFPGNLHLVLVLRPTGFLQRTFTDIGFRRSQEDFMLKLPVVMLSSVSDLRTYVDDKQLTPELGGTLQYCHSEWIIFRNAVENFALTVKEMAQMLQSFGAEMAETELPDDIPSTEEILAVRAERYHLLKNNITTVTEEGKILLTNLEASDTEEAVSSGVEHFEQINSDWHTINKLLTQLHDMETAFDRFWEKHQVKMEQYLQLWKFEQNFHELVSEIELLLNQQAELADLTGNIVEVKQKIKMLENIDDNSQDLLAKTRFVISHGHKLAADHHYALDLICQQCHELRYFSDTLVNEIKARRIHLSRTFKMHQFLQQAQQCCDEGEYVLATQEVDTFQSKEDAEKALKDVDNFIEMALPFTNYDPEALQYEFGIILSPELKLQMRSVQLKLGNMQSMLENQQGGFRKLTDKHVKPVQFVAPDSSNLTQSRAPRFSPQHGRKIWRQNRSNLEIEVMRGCQEKRISDPSSSLGNDNSLAVLKNCVLTELIQTERVYVLELYTVLLGYRAEMNNPEMFDLMPPLLRSKRDVLFGNMAEIYEFHNNIFLSSLENCVGAPEGVGPCFLERKDDFQMYAIYCQNKPRSEAIWKKFSECAFFQECRRKLKHRLGLDTYLVKPVQRLTKYQLLLKELLKYSKDCKGSDELNKALDTMRDLLKSVNDSMHQTAIHGYIGNLNELGKMIIQGAFSVWNGHKKGATKMKDFARFKPMQRHIFLYEKAVIFCKRHVESGESSTRYPSYNFKHCLKILNFRQNVAFATENLENRENDYLDSRATIAQVLLQGYNPQITNGLQSNGLFMDEVGVTEYVKGDDRKFEIWYVGKEEVYIIQAPNTNVKMTWVKEIRIVLLKQQELKTVKEEKQHNELTKQNKHSSQQNDEKQQGAFIDAKETESGHTRAMVEVGEAAVSVQAVDTVGTEMPPPLEISEATEEWLSNNFYSSYDDNEGDEKPLMSSGRYKALADCRKRGSEDLRIRSGAVIQLLHEEADGQRTGLVVACSAKVMLGEFYVTDH